jgi:hypothetical protein
VLGLEAVVVRDMRDFRHFDLCDQLKVACCAGFLVDGSSEEYFADRR